MVAYGFMITWEKKLRNRQDFVSVFYWKMAVRSPALSLNRNCEFSVKALGNSCWVSVDSVCAYGSQLVSTVTVAYAQSLRVYKTSIVSYSVLMSKFGSTLTKVKHFVCPTSPWNLGRIVSLQSPFPTFFSPWQFPLILTVEYATLSMILLFNATHFSQSLKLSLVFYLVLRRIIFSDSKTDYVGFLRGNLHVSLVAPSREVVQR